MSKDTNMVKRGDRPEGIQQRPAVAPAVDVFENKDELLIVADMPGVQREQLKLHLEKGKLTLDARRDEASEGNLLAAEFRPVDYRRTFLVPQGIDADRISAELTHGVLRLKLPKSAAVKPRTIQVKIG
jgi:HSP20 family molecular chaperone IbpA